MSRGAQQRLLLTAAMTTWLALAAPAGAGVGRVEGTPSDLKLVYEDGADVSNVVTLSSDFAGVVIHDAGGVAAGPGCAAVDAQLLRCTSLPEIRLSTGRGDDRVSIESSAPMYVWAELGAGNDALTSTRRTLDVDAGAGDDVVRADEARLLYGGAGDDVLASDGSRVLLLGGPGDDDVQGGGGESLLVGGGGGDRLRGGAGDDTIDGDGADRIMRPFAWGYYAAPTAVRARSLAPGDDVIDGGPGRDTLELLTRRDDLRVHLGAGVLRGRRDRDRLLSLERVLGGLGDDVLIGSLHDDALVGGYSVDAGAGPGSAGRDVLIGRAGDDTLEGSGDDRLDGGPGDDQLTSPDPRSTCGRGMDLVDGDRSRLPPRDCERMFLGDVEVDPFHAAVRGRFLRVPILAHLGSDGGSSTWTVRGGWGRRGPVLGRRDGQVRRRAKALVIRLSRRGAAYVAGGGRRVSVSRHWFPPESDMDEEDTGPGAVLIRSVS